MNWKKLNIIIAWYNEEKNINKLAKSLQYISESNDIPVDIIYCDQSSIDKSIDIIKKYSYIQIRHHEKYWLWEISRIKIHNEEIDESEWLLFLDADEELTPMISDEIVYIIQSEEYDIGWIKFDLLFMWIKLSTAKQPRLFKKWSTLLQNIPHNHFVQVSNRQTTLTHKMINHDLKQYGQEINIILEKLNRYTDKEMDQYKKISKLRLLYQMFFKPIIWFFWFGIWWWYFFKGISWWICAFHNAAYEFFKGAKLYEKFYSKKTTKKLNF